MTDTKLVQGLLLTTCLCLIVAIVFAVADIAMYGVPLQPLRSAAGATAAPTAPEQPAELPAPESPVQTSQ